MKARLRDALKDYWLIWRYAVVYRETTHVYSLITRVFINILFGLFALVWIVFILHMQGQSFPAQIIFLTGNIAAWIGIRYWKKLFIGAFKLNHPTTANLVPKIRVRTIELLQFAWMILSIGIATVIWSVFGSFWLIVLFVGSGLLLIVQMFSAGTGTWWPTLLAACAGFFIFLTAPYFPTIADVSTNAIILVIANVWLFWTGCHFFRQVFLKGREQYPAKLDSITHSFNPGLNQGLFAVGAHSSTQKGPAKAHTAKSNDFLLWFAATDPASLMPRIFKRQNNQAASRQVLPAVERGEAATLRRKFGNLLSMMSGFLLLDKGLWQILFYALLFAITSFGLSLAGVSEFSTLIFPLWLIDFWSLKQFPRDIAASSPEQALIRLSPLVPSLPGLNRHLAQRILRNFLSGWLQWLGGALLGAVFLGKPPTSLMMLIALCCMVLPFVGATLVDYSADGVKQFHTAVIWTSVGMILLASLFFMLFDMFGAGEMYRMPWLLAFTLTSVALAVVFIAVRWRMMIAAPIAFPSGRKGA